MSTFVVAIFPNLAVAHMAIRALRDITSKDAFHLYGVATITKDGSGKITMNVMADDGLAVTLTGALLGGLAGLAIEPLAAVILAIGGAVFGVSAALTNRGAGMVFANRTARHLAPHRTAVVVEVTADDSGVVISRLEAVGGNVIRRETMPGT